LQIRELLPLFNQMRLSTYSDYALRVLMQAALQAPELTTIDEVASAFAISRNHLTKVVHELARHGFLATRRGIGGGFTLGLAAQNIRLGDVVRLTEADDKVIDCINHRNTTCALFPACRLKEALAEASRAFFAVLDRYSLQDLIKRKSEMKELLDI
jgi:Rrf2 family nitric oxide-sensitive transcriptional repressor